MAVALANPIKVKSGKTYLPEDFFSKVLKYKTKENGQTLEITTNWNLCIKEGTDFWLNINNQYIYKTDVKNNSKKIFQISLNDIVKENIQDYVYSLESVEYTPENNYLISVRYNLTSVAHEQSANPFGDENYIDLYYINAQNGIMHKISTTLKAANHMGRVDKINFTSGNDIVLPGDDTFLLIDDTSGKTINKYDLKAYLKNDANYIGEKINYINYDGDYILCRTEGTKSQQFLTLYLDIALINIKTGKITWVQDALIKQENIDYYYNDEWHFPLEFLKEENGKLCFLYEDYTSSKEIYYNLQISQ